MREQVNLEKLALKSIDSKEEEEAFGRYKKDFGFTVENLQGKSVLDLGCGTSLDFLKYCLRQEINITGMDARLPADIEDTLIKGHLVQGDIHRLPFKEEKFDLILCRALPDITITEIESILSLLKPGGEIKISPYFPDTNSDHKELIDEIKSLQKELNFTAFVVLVDIQITKGEKFPRYTLTIKRN